MTVSQTIPPGGFFTDSGFDFEARIALGSAGVGVGDVGLVFATLDRITDSDPQSWFDAWRDSAAAVATQADAASATGHHRSAGWYYLAAAEYYAKFYTVLFANPAMEAINYWDLGPSLVRGMRGGLNAGTGQAGLLDPTKDDEPRPLYHRLKKLITETWTTRLTTALKPDGAVAFRGFHGDYEVSVRMPDGKMLKGKFMVKPGEGNTYRVKLGEDVRSLATGR